MLCGSLSTYFNMDVVKQKCVVAGGMMISDFVGWCEQQQLDLAWAPKGMCYSSVESQCFAGFVATNVHHHNTPTAYQYVNAIRLAVFVDGKPALVDASREHHSELFESVFGGIGMSGVIVSLDIRLSKTPTYNVSYFDGQIPLQHPEALRTMLMPMMEPETSRWSSFNLRSGEFWQYAFHPVDQHRDVEGVRSPA